MSALSKIIICRNYLSMYYLKTAQLFPGYHETPSLHQVYWHNHHQQERNECGVYLNFLLRFYCSYRGCYWTSHKRLSFLHSQAVDGCIYYPKEWSLRTRFCQQNILWYSHFFRVLLTMSLLLLWSVQLEEENLLFINCINFNILISSILGWNFL